MSRPFQVVRELRGEGMLRRSFAVVGYIPFLGARGKVGCLLLALCDHDGAYHFAGTVRTGFTGSIRVQLGELLEKDHVEQSAVVDSPRLGTLERWALPRYVVEVQFAEWTRGCQVVHPTFLRLCEDKQPNECMREDGVERHVVAGAVATVA
jgi:bifunctional non-homologous end joining protein LigD